MIILRIRYMLVKLGLITEGRCSGVPAPAARCMGKAYANCRPGDQKMNAGLCILTC
jgi:hypothetical protein